MSTIRSTYECANAQILTLQRHHAHDAAAKNEKANKPMDCVVANVLDAAGSQEHVQGNVELHQADQQPGRDNVRGPKEQQRLEQIENPKDSKNSKQKNQRIKNNDTN